MTVSGSSLTGLDALNYQLSVPAGLTASITPAVLTVGAVGTNRVYNGLLSDTVSLTDNRFAGDVLNLANTSAVFADKNVGTAKAVTVSGITVTGLDAINYTFNTTAATTANITPKDLIISATGVDKVYDGGLLASETLSDNRIANDVLTLGLGTASYLDKNVANGKTVNVSGITLTGTDAANYTFNTTASTTANITPRALTISATGVDKVYDGGLLASETLADNRIVNDVLTLGLGTASYLDKNVANGKTVNVSGITVTGVDAANYTFNTTASTTANITPAVLTISATGVDKVYDGGLLASETLSDNRIVNDVLTLGLGTASYLDKNVANGKTVNVSGITVTGVDAANYTFNTTASTTANITPAVLTISATGVNKVYDGGLLASETLTDNRIANDVLTLGLGTASYLDKNVANGKTVNVSGITVTGVDAGNYTFNTTASTTANITPATLTVTGLSASNKVYDATTAATLLGTGVLTGKFVGDVVNLAGTVSGVFADKNVGAAKVVTVSGSSLTGLDALNYQLSVPAGLTASITPAVLTVGAVGTNRVYNGLLSDTVSLTDNRFAGDVLNLANTSAVFADKNVANGKAVSVTGISVTGTDATNYTFNTTASTTANITPAVLTISATGVNKVYDGGLLASETLADNRIANDVLILGLGTASYLDKNVANGKTVNVSGITLTGTDATNYTFNTTASTTANITPRALTISATGVNKVYDGGLLASETLSDNRIANDVLTLGLGTASYLDKNVANGKTVNVSGITVTGVDAANYTFNTTASTTANITPKALTISATGVNKVYDGGLLASETLSDNRIANDVLTLGLGTASYLDKNVANGKTVNVSGITVTGVDAANYTFNTTASTTANITPRALTISATGVNKVYDGGLLASETLTDNRIANDVLTLGLGTASYLDKNVANGKTVNVSGITVTGVDAGNYTFNSTANTTANITPATLTVTGLSASNKVYDATTTATLLGTGVLTGKFVGDTVNLAGTVSGVFADKNVGAAKVVTVSGSSLTGLDALNYTVVAPTGLLANITPATLTVTGLSASNKVYDATTAATLLGTGVLTGSFVGDVVNLAGTVSGVFLDKNVGAAKVVTVSGSSLTGLDALNYTVVAPTGLLANITPATLTVTGLSASNKVYDATTAATLLGTGVLTGKFCW